MNFSKRTYYSESPLEETDPRKFSTAIIPVWCQKLNARLDEFFAVIETLKNFLLSKLTAFRDFKSRKKTPKG